jgi:alkanesulfonate monooxygenase SsuD/methylene tetrahydromethanopterin reductase-like flavin-dependent oxidoreductase (luciferase family)
MQLGVFLPSYLLPGNQAGLGDHQIRRFAARSEDLGFASLFITDHLLPAPRFYRVSWTEPLMTLCHAAAVTSRIMLGTSILVRPTHNPVILAKEIATLQASVRAASSTGSAPAGTRRSSRPQAATAGSEAGAPTRC